MKSALICGVSGQDGAYLSRFLLKKGYRVFGTSRDAQVSSFKNLKKLGIKEKITVESMALNDFRSVLQIITKIKPDEIYNLAGQSSVYLSFDQPVDTLESISLGTLNILESIRFTQLPIKFYNAGSSECFGDTRQEPANEHTPFKPRSPYAVAKAAAFWEVSNYREAYDIFACSGILFNHESSLRHERFVTQKIVTAAKKISAGESIRLELGNLNVWRDWGWAPEYVEAMWLMLQEDSPDDYVIATGKTHSLEEFVEYVFEYFGLDWKNYVVLTPKYVRPTDLVFSSANPDKAKRKLGWSARHDMYDVINIMIEGRL